MNGNSLSEPSSPIMTKVSEEGPSLTILPPSSDMTFSSSLLAESVSPALNDKLMSSFSERPQSYFTGCLWSRLFFFNSSGADVPAGEGALFIGIFFSGAFSSSECFSLTDGPYHKWTVLTAEQGAVRSPESMELRWLSHPYLNSSFQETETVS